MKYVRLEPWKPRVYMWDGGWLGIGRSSGVVPPHRHHAIQVCVALEGHVRVRTPDSDWRQYAGAMVRPDEDHSFDGCGALGAMMFIDPECHEGRWLLHSLDATITEIPAAKWRECVERLRTILDDPPDAEALASLIGETVHGLCSGPPPILHLDERIVRALEIIHEADGTRLSLDAVARAVYLSPSRFAHLFTEQVGLPFRRYVLWRKLNLAMMRVRKGSTLSAAAHACGFSDSAHLTRTFNQMFGIPPSVMIGGGDTYEIPAPFQVASR